MERYLIVLSFLTCLMSCSPRQYSQGRDLLKEDNDAILKSQMSDSLFYATQGRQISSRNRLVKTKRDAFEHTMPVFLEKYGDDFNVKDRLYAFDLRNGFWIVKGMLPKGYAGGTLVAILDARKGDLISTFIWK